MALSYFTESEAPRDFRVSSTESDGHYKKCVLCYTVKRNFYCPDCIRSGNFVHSSMPYSDKFLEKQAKLLRVKANRRHVLDRCEKLLAPKLKQDSLLTDVKQSRDKIDLIRLAIEQRKQNIEDKKKELSEINKYNNELKQKLPRYQKRVASLGKHDQSQKLELESKVRAYGDQAQDLAALRRSRIRQLNKYIFPVYMTYDDASNSIEDMEFVGEDAEEEVPRRCQLHIGTPWINADGDIQHLLVLLNESQSVCEGGVGGGAARLGAGLGLAAQLAALLAALLDADHAAHVCVSSCYWGRWSVRGVRRLCRALLRLAHRAARPPPPPPPPPEAPHPPPRDSLSPLQVLHNICMAAAADEPTLGRVESYTGGEESEWSQWGEWGECGEWEGEEGEGEGGEPEHLSWPEGGEFPSPPRGTPPAASLVTSAAASLASLASFWRGWAK